MATIKACVIRGALLAALTLLLSGCERQGEPPVPTPVAIPASAPQSALPASGANKTGQPEVGGQLEFDHPRGIAVDNAGNLYLFIPGPSDAILKISPGGVVSTLAYVRAEGLATDNSGSVYVADSYRHAIHKITPDGKDTILAGGGAAGHADGSKGAASFDHPAAITADRAGNLYVADNRTTIRKITQEGVVTTLAGRAGERGSADGRGEAARFAGIDGIAADGEGNVYVADGYAIRKVSPNGVVTTLAGRAGEKGNADGMGEAARFGILRGMAADSAGNIYVADSGSHAVRKVSPEGMVTTVAGHLWEQGDDFVFGVAADGAGNLYVTDNPYIRKISPAGAVTTLSGPTGSNPGAASFNAPSGLAVDDGGNIYVADTGNHTIRRISAEGMVTTLAGTATVSGHADGEGAAATFNEPAAIAVDSARNLYVADTGNNVIRKITPAGVVTTLAGSAEAQGSKDGIGNAARFNGPHGIAVDGAGNLYVADTGNRTIRKITPAGRVTTLAGKPSPGEVVAKRRDGSGASARFATPFALALDEEGNLYVCDSDNIRKVTPDGMVTTLDAVDERMLADRTGFGMDEEASMAAHIANPNAIAVNGKSGAIYLVDINLGNAGVVRVIANGSDLSTLTGGSGNDEFSQPLGLAIDSSGTLYVADTGHNTIKKVTADGTTTTLAGLINAAGHADGPGRAVQPKKEKGPS